MPCITLTKGVVLLFVLAGLTACGAKQPEEKPGDTLATKAVEKIVEKGLQAEGVDAKVQINPDAQTLSVTMTDEENKTSAMTMNMSDESAEVTISGDDKSMKMRSGEGAKIPDSFPKDVPLYTGMNINMVMEMGAQEFSVTATSADTLADITAFFKKACTEQGWTEITVMTQGDAMSMLSYEKGDRALAIMLSRDAEQTGISITVAMN